MTVNYHKLAEMWWQHLSYSFCWSIIILQYLSGVTLSQSIPKFATISSLRLQTC